MKCKGRKGGGVGGLTFDGLASHPGRNSNTPIRFMLTGNRDKLQLSGGGGKGIFMV